MPRRRRPSPPPRGSIHTRQIAPKPSLKNPQPDDTNGRMAFPTPASTPVPTPSTSRQSTAGSDTEVAFCGVPQCSTPNCNLTTHLNYGRQRRLALLHSRSKSGSAPSSPGDITEATSALTLHAGVGDQLKLPIKDSTDLNFQRLITQFFNEHFDRIVLVFRPQRRDPAFKQVVYRLALHNEIYCLTLIAQSHMCNIKDNQTTLDAATNQLTDDIYSKLLQITREKVESFDLEDVDVLLLAIVALCEYDLKLDRYDALRSHHIGMTALVSKRGGIHNLGLSLPYVLRMDRFLAVRANQMPQFSSPELPNSSIIIHNTDDLSYGASFQDNRSSLSEEVVSICTDAALMLDLMEELDVTFDPSKFSITPHPKLEYFYFVRENIDARHAVLNYQNKDSKNGVNKDLLALTAMKTVNYFVTAANYLPVLSDMLATRLWNMLTKSPSTTSRSLLTTPGQDHGDIDPSYIPTIDLSDWIEDMPTLLWLLFACALPSSREVRLSFTAHLSENDVASSAATAGHSHQSRRTSPTSHAQSYQRYGQGHAIVSPSSPRRHRYLPSFILHVAEHLIGERPLSGTAEWDEEITEILVGFVWSEERLSREFAQVISRIHDITLARAEGEGRV